MRGIVAHLARGGIVAILTDQYERRAAPLDFLGRPAPTSTVAAELALKYKLPLIPIYGIRDPDGAARGGGGRGADPALHRARR